MFGDAPLAFGERESGVAAESLRADPAVQINWNTWTCSHSTTVACARVRGGPDIRYRVDVTDGTQRIVLELDSVLVARLDRVARFARAAGVASLTRDELIVDAVERYLTGAEMAAPGMSQLPLDPGDE